MLLQPLQWPPHQSPTTWHFKYSLFLNIGFRYGCSSPLCYVNPNTILSAVTLMRLDIGKMSDHAQKYASDSDMNLKNSFWKKNIRNLPGRYLLHSTCRLFLYIYWFFNYLFFVFLLCYFIVEQVLRKKANPYLHLHQLHLMIFKKVLVMHGKLKLRMKYYVYLVKYYFNFYSIFLGFNINHLTNNNLFSSL